MIKLRTIIADDEPFLRQELKRKLQQHPNIELVAECENGIQALDAANRLQPDLMFLDIVMPGLDGLEVVQALQSDAMPIIIFATAYDQFAIQAFDVRAMDYLVKPYTDERLDQSIETALLHYKDNPVEHKGKLIEIATHLQHKQVNDAEDADFDDWPQRIVIENKEPQVTVNVEDIAWVDAAGDYMCIHANGETYILRSTMKRLNRQLNPDHFKRIHRSTIVNLHYIADVYPFRKGDYFVELTSGTRLRLSRSYNDALQDLMAAIATRKAPR